MRKARLRSLWGSTCKAVCDSPASSLPLYREMSAARDPQGEVLIVGGARTPFGSFLGSLAPLSATQLGAAAMKGSLQAAGVSPVHVEEVFMGNVLGANLGQAPCRQAALGAGLPDSVVCTTVNKVCASGMKAAMLAALTIKSGMRDIVVAGGMESMSNCPHYLPGTARDMGLRMGHAQLVDGMIKDGLWDPYNAVHMGECAEACAAERGITRRQQDAHALASVERARAALLSGATAQEMCAVETSGRGRLTEAVTADEPLARAKPERLPTLRPAFSQSDSATVTAGNSSPITDGAAALVLASPAAAAKLGLKVLARVIGMADAAQPPAQFCTAPALAIPRAIAHAGLTAADVDFYEINEAFSVVDLANRQMLQLDDDRVNVHGGSVALGHPIGASGAAILVRLLNVLRCRDARTGVAAICNGGGGASVMVIQRL